MASATRPALRVPNQYDPSFKVDIHIHKPIWTSTNGDTMIHIQMLSLCAQLDFLCKKELAHTNSGRIDHGSISNAFETKAMMILAKLMSTTKRLPLCKQNVEDYLDYTGLAYMFPRASAYITRPTDLSLTLKETKIDGYFKKMASLNQLISTAQQLNSDIITLKNHKYIAHQIALLFQSLDKNASCFTGLRKAIEVNFSSIKNTLNEGGEAPQLTDEQHKWLLNLTHEVVSVASSFLVEINQHMIPLAEYLKQK